MNQVMGLMKFAFEHCFYSYEPCWNIWNCGCYNWTLTELFKCIGLWKLFTSKTPNNGCYCNQPVVEPSASVQLTWLFEGYMKSLEMVMCVSTLLQALLISGRNYCCCFYLWNLLMRWPFGRVNYIVVLLGVCSMFRFHITLDSFKHIAPMVLKILLFRTTLWITHY